MRSSFAIKPLVTAIAAFSVASVAQAAGLDRSGQDTTAFFQDGTYAEAVYTYIDADVTGKDERGKKISDIAESYDFFRYGVKTDIDDTFSIGVLYDEPWGAAADYSGDNTFVGPDNVTGAGIVQSVADQGIRNTSSSIQQIQNILNNENTSQTERQVLSTALPVLQGSLNQFEKIKENPSQENLQNFINTGKEQFDNLKPTISAVQDQLSPQALQILNNTEKGLVQAGQGAGAAAQVNAQNQGAVLKGTKVEVRSNSLSLIGGMKFGANNQFQIYGGPVAQRIKAEVRLRGDAYKGASGYTATLLPDQDYGFLAGISYSKPEIALKAALTYRSEIDHSINLREEMPGAFLKGKASARNGVFEITTPESYNFDLQTGINPTTLATAKVRYVPWSDFSISPTLYNEVSGVPLVNYSDDQWQVELGLGKRIADNLAISGTVGWDSGAGNPTTSLGPIEGYYSVGLGAKYDITKNWAISAGGKYLMFGDAKGSLPDRDVVSDFDDNDGFALGVKLSYQDK
ncbi:outer membrane protein transport protein [Psychrobacter sanguinis]|uniref:Long-chain fatty acid transporter n=1 Tax=Psychrobacter sanguinis TaxID=861445 RepID=A0A844M250_9GAMM|nr:outer membrane protein transport protein [Psychrobacter sanguinis]MUG32874.1 hypothetical protein [Psychrobacter sanguinis]